MTDKKIVVSPEVLYQELKDESVLLDLRSNVYYKLNGVAGRAWQLFCDNDSLDAVAAQITREYAIQQTTVTNDLNVLVARLAEFGLLSIQE